MADSIKVSLASMVDLALCSPEIGAVNFNILRSLLLMMLQQLEMSDLTVELSGQEYAAAHTDKAVQKITQSVKKGERGVIQNTEIKPAHGSQVAEINIQATKLQKKVPDTETEQLKVRGEGEATGTGKQAAEDTYQKLSAPVDDMVKDSSSLQNMAAERERIVDSTVDQTIAIGAPGGPELNKILSSLRDDLDSVRKDVDQIIDEIHSISEFTEKVPFEALYSSVKEIDDLKSKLEELTVKLSEKSVDQEDDESKGEEEESVTAQLHELHEKLNTLNDQLQGLDSNFTSQIEGLLEQIGALECDLGQVMEKMNIDQPEGDAITQDFTGLGELQSRLQQLQSDMEHVNQVATKLMDDEEEHHLQFEALVEQVEVLKMVKADREVVEDALAEKADQVVVNRKVSHEQFDIACDDLARGLDEAFTKLCQQETIWKNALDDVQNEIGQKLDKVELTPLRDFIQQRLKVLQDKLKALAARKELEAAGTKKFLRDVNCISCDKDVVMKKQLDTPNIPIQPSLPPARSIRPYVTYELDKLRHQQKRPMGKNLLQLEDMEQEFEKKTRKEKTSHEEQPEHLVNRYCGGSHTVIAPHQRVMRAGYQPTQPNTEALGFTEITIRGTDGQLYLGQEMPPKIIRKADVTEATQTSEMLLKRLTKDAPAEEPIAKGDSKAIKAKSPNAPKSPAKTPKSPPATPETNIAVVASSEGSKSSDAVLAQKSSKTSKISTRQSLKGSKVAFTEPENESPAAQGS